MVFGQEFLGTEGFEIIEKNWEKFVKVGEKFVKVGHLFGKVGGRLRKIWQNIAKKVKKAEIWYK